MQFRSDPSNNSIVAADSLWIRRSEILYSLPISRLSCLKLVICSAGLKTMKIDC